MIRTFNLTHLSMATAALLALVFSASASAQDRIYTGLFNNNAVGGYDAVAYFTQGEPVRGDRDFITEWRGANWRFASQDNLDLFLADPESYAPQYGGYCAWAMANGDFAKGDPEYWRIVDGKLYLNYDANIQQRWEADIPGFIERANVNWAEFEAR